MGFPQLRLCLCLDGLYAKGPVLQTCHDNDWKYFITFQKGSMPALWKDYLSLRRLSPANRKRERHRRCLHARNSNPPVRHSSR